MNELKHINFLCWLHTYSSEFIFSVYVRDVSLRIAFKSYTPASESPRWSDLGLLLTDESHLWLCWIFSICLSRTTLSMPLHSTLCPRRLIHMSYIKSPRLSVSQDRPKGSTIRNLKAKKKMRSVMWLPSSPNIPRSSGRAHPYISFCVAIAAPSFYSFQAKGA